jgi:hypothetical protein
MEGNKGEEEIELLPKNETAGIYIKKPVNEKTEKMA